MSKLKSLEKLRGFMLCKVGDSCNVYEPSYSLADEIEREIAERFMLKSDVEIDKNAVQEYNLDVQVVAGQKIEYTIESRHRRGATTSMSVAFHLE